MAAHVHGRIDVKSGWLCSLAGLACLLMLPALAGEPEPWTLQTLVGSPTHWRVSGSFRSRYEALDGQFRPGLDGSDRLVSLRTTLAAEYRGTGWRAGGELFDSRAYFDDNASSVGTGEVNTFELVQAYVAADLGAVLGADTQTTATGGRFTLDLGSRRLVARNDFRNTTNAFTGIHVDWRGSDREQLTLFYTFPQLRLPADKRSVIRNRTEFDQETDALTFWGGYLSAPALHHGAFGEIYVFGLDERDAPGRPTRNRRLFTPGSRFYRPAAAGTIDYEVEGAYQFGDVRTSSAASAPKQDVSAWFVHVQVGRTFKRAWTPRIAVAYDRATGDHAGSASNNRFDTLFGARRFDFGPTGIYGPLARSNLSSPEVRLEIKPDSRWDGLIAYRAAWLDSSTDSFSNTGVRDARGRAGDFAGHQVETRARYWLRPRQVRLEAGGAIFFNSRFFDDAPNASGHGNPLFGYTSLSVFF